MFYVKVDKDNSLYVKDIPDDMSVPIQDDEMNLYKYWYDDGNHRIVNRREITYTFEATENGVRIIFDMDSSFNIKVRVTHSGRDIAENTIFVERNLVRDDEHDIVLVDEKPTLLFNSKVNGIIFIESGSPIVCFDPLVIECNELIDERMPEVIIGINEVLVDESYESKRFRDMQEQIDKLKSGYDDLLELILESDRGEQHE